MRLAGSKKARDPDSHLPGRIGFRPLVDCLKKPGDKLAEMLIELFRDDEFVELLPDGRGIDLIGLHDAVDGPEDVAFEEVLDEHGDLALWNQLEGSVVVLALDLAEEPERLSVVSTGVEHHKRCLAHDRLKVVQKGVGAKQWPDASNSGDDDQIVFVGLRNFRKQAAEFGLVQRSRQGFLECLVSLVPLHPDRLAKQVAALEVLKHEVEQVDVFDPEGRPLLGNVRRQRAHELSNLELDLGRVVENVESDLVADTAAAQELVGDDLRQNLIEAFGKIAHWATWMQRRTYASL